MHRKRSELEDRLWLTKAEKDFYDRTWEVFYAMSIRVEGIFRRDILCALFSVYIAILKHKHVLVCLDVTEKVHANSISKQKSRKDLWKMFHTNTSGGVSERV